ncbi:MAG: hypothetical protein LBT26_06025 [Clostridiales Family XIII bacterium]|jgi:ABC-type transport system involved in cytochrome bd biosynthesis fused ATPase/permease subunit|nr:hypothetical protein [Clostridiales Family XIII bacterium]
METQETRQEDRRLIEEYLAVSKKQQGQLSLGIVLASLVFIIPMLIIILNGWWGPFGGDSAVGMRWFLVACAAMVLAYISLIVDKFYRNF